MLDLNTRFIQTRSVFYLRVTVTSNIIHILAVHLTAFFQEIFKICQIAYRTPFWPMYIFEYWLPSLAPSSQTLGNQEKSWIEVAGFAKITGFRIQIGERDRKQKQTDFRGQTLDFWHFHHFQILYFSRKPYPPCHSASYQEVPSLRPPRRHLPELGRITGSSYFFLARFKLEWKEHSVYSNRYGGILTLVQSLIFVHI